MRWRKEVVAVEGGGGRHDRRGHLSVSPLAGEFWDGSVGL